MQKKYGAMFDAGTAAVDGGSTENANLRIPTNKLFRIRESCHDCSSGQAVPAMFPCTDLKVISLRPPGVLSTVYSRQGTRVLECESSMSLLHDNINLKIISILYVYSNNTMDYSLSSLLAS